MFDVAELLTEYDRARAYTDQLWRDLSAEEVCWRPNENSSAIGWHLGHQAHVAHFMVRNLTAAEPSPDPALDQLMDSANPVPARGELPDLDRLISFRTTVAERVHARMADIDQGRTGAPAQLRIISQHLLTAVINHEYQHDRWIGEVRARDLGHALPDDPASGRLTQVDGYIMICSAFSTPLNDTSETSFSGGRIVNVTRPLRTPSSSLGNRPDVPRPVRRKIPDPALSSPRH
jgi:hypothetical protein